MNIEIFNNLKQQLDKRLSRREILYLRKFYNALSILFNDKKEYILNKHCGVRPKLKPTLPNFDPITGQINLKYNPKFIDQDYYIT